MIALDMVGSGLWKGVGVWVCVDGPARGSNLLLEGGLVVGVGRLLVSLDLAFLDFTFIQGFEDFWALRSLSLAVPYFSSLTGHLLASAGWLLSTWLFAVQLMHLRSCGQWPSAEVSIVSPYSFAVMHLWQLAGSVGWCSFSSWWPLQSGYVFKLILAL